MDIHTTYQDDYRRGYIKGGGGGLVEGQAYVFQRFQKYVYTYT